MESDDERSLLAFNGEVYNFRAIRSALEERGLRFRSESDTECVLRSLDVCGPSALEQFEGMFAIAHYDVITGELLLARDPLGQKPLYFLRLGDGGIAFASELNTLMDLVTERRFSAAGLESYLQWGYSYGTESIVEGISKVEPGTYLQWTPSRQQVQRYWALPSRETSGSDRSELLDLLEETMETAVRRTLVSDVPVGVLLSGGVDSAVVAALAARNQPGIRTYSVAFPGHAVDESRVSTAIAKRLGTAHTVLQGADMDLAHLERTFADQDEPIGDPSILPTSILCEAVSAECRVVLGGDGGDELFGGYEHYRHIARMQSGIWEAASRVGAPLGRAGLRLSGRGLRGRYWMELLARDPRTVEPPIGRLFLNHQVRHLLAAGSTTTEPIAVQFAARGAPVMEGVARTDLLHYLPNDILHKVDRCSMRYSLEVRAPFLDRDVLTLALGRIPTALKVDAGHSKILLGQLRSRLLGEGLDLGRKQGFTPPLDAILQTQQVRTFIGNVLSSAPTSTWDTRELSRWIRALDQGRRVQWQIFALAALIDWQLRWKVEGVAHTRDESRALPAG